MNVIDRLLELWDAHSGGLIPEPFVGREVFHGDRSQRVTVGLLWLRIRVKGSLDLPHEVRWDPR